MIDYLVLYKVWAISLLTFYNFPPEHVHEGYANFCLNQSTRDVLFNMVNATTINNSMVSEFYPIAQNTTNCIKMIRRVAAENSYGGYGNSIFWNEPRMWKGETMSDSIKTDEWRVVWG